MVQLCNVSGAELVAIVVMGVAGCGKSTLGKALAVQLDCQFIEGDNHHPPASIAKMARGEPLDDEDRWPWLDAIAAELREPGPKVVSCSALKGVYRQRLRIGAARPLHFAHIEVDRRKLARRLERRENHFYPATLLTSQLAILEPPDPFEADAKKFDGEKSVEQIIDSVVNWLNPSI